MALGCLASVHCGSKMPQMGSSLLIAGTENGRDRFCCRNSIIERGL